MRYPIISLMTASKESSIVLRLPHVLACIQENSDVVRQYEGSYLFSNAC